MGVRPGAPVNHSGRCHKAQITPRMRLALRALLPACRQGRAYPRHPISSPSALPGKIIKASRITAVSRGIPKLRAGPPRKVFKPTMPPARAAGPSTTTRYQRGSTRQIRSRASSLRRAPFAKDDGCKYDRQQRRDVGREDDQDQALGGGDGVPKEDERDPKDPGERVGQGEERDEEVSSYQRHEAFSFPSQVIPYSASQARDGV